MPISMERPQETNSYCKLIADTIDEFTERSGTLPRRLYLTPRALNDLHEFFCYSTPCVAETGSMQDDVEKRLTLFGLSLVVSSTPAAAAFHDYCTYELACDYEAGYTLRCGIYSADARNLSIVNARVPPLVSASDSPERMREATRAILHALTDAAGYITECSREFQAQAFTLHARNTYNPKTETSISRYLTDTPSGRAFLRSPSLTQAMNRVLGI